MLFWRQLRFRFCSFINSFLRFTLNGRYMICMIRCEGRGIALNFCQIDKRMGNTFRGEGEVLHLYAVAPWVYAGVCSHSLFVCCR